MNPAPNALQAEYVKLIAELDKSISVIRLLWTEERDLMLKRDWMKKIDALLDERLRLMKVVESWNTVIVNS